MAKRSYSDEEKAQALATYDACGSLTETSRISGIPDSTLSQWIAKRGVNDSIAEMREFKKRELADKLELIAHQCANLLPERIPEASVREIVGAMGQSIEKAQLLRGQPTEITSTFNRRSFVEAELKRLRSVTADDYAYAASVRQFQSLFTDTTDPAYDPLLDYTKHPENWPVMPTSTDTDTPTASDANN